MRGWLSVILPIASALVLATVVVAVFTKETALARSLVATLVWGLVLFELVFR